MTDIFGTSSNRPKHWVLRACALLVLLAVVLQMAHVHAENDFSNAICLACVSAHTSVPVAAIVLPAFLVAITFVIVERVSEPESSEALLNHFIRPPPCC